MNVWGRNSRTLGDRACGAKFLLNISPGSQLLIVMRCLWTSTRIRIKHHDHLCIINNLPPYYQGPLVQSVECVIWWSLDTLDNSAAITLSSWLPPWNVSLHLSPLLPSEQTEKAPRPCPLCRLLNAEGDYCFEQSGLVIRLLSATWDVNILGILFTVPK